MTEPRHACPYCGHDLPEKDGGVRVLERAEVCIKCSWKLDDTTRCCTNPSCTLSGLIPDDSERESR
jgi:hypothetical protein